MVYNWQLGREMEYAYPAAYPERQFAFAINTNRCLGCHTCSMACKSTWTFSKGQEHMWWNSVETKPYGGYPQNWELKTLALLDQNNRGENIWTGKPDDAERAQAPYGRFDGKTVFERTAKMATPNRVLGYLPDEEDWRFPNAGEDVVGPASVPVTADPNAGPTAGWMFYLPRLCNHCTYPACVAACSRTAAYKRPEDGVVLIDQRECRGYRRCLEACPYKRVLYRPNTGVSEKCVGCFPRLEGADSGGVAREAACMAACIGQVRLQGFLKLDRNGAPVADRQNPLYYLIHVAQVALPLYPQFGTQPNGYYIPPRWAPRPFLKQMFGPGVERALERYSLPDRELLAVLQLFRKTDRMIFSYRLEKGAKVSEREVNGKPLEFFDDAVIAFGRDGQELFRSRVQP